MKNGFDSHRTNQVLYDSSRRSIKRRREEEESNYGDGRPSDRRRREEETNYGGRPSDRRRREEETNYGGRPSDRRRTEEETNYGGRPSDRRRREERNSRRDVSLDIGCGYGRLSFSKRRREDCSSRGDVSLDINYGYGRGREERHSRGDVSLNFHSSQWSSNRRSTREDSNRGHDHSCSGRSVIKEDNFNIPIGKGKCDVSSCKFYKEEDYATPVGSLPCFVDDYVVTEILSRLPLKSLLRFKSVCKHWRSLITRDPHFIHFQSTRLESRLNLLCIAPLEPRDDEKSKTLPQRILTANLSFKTSSGSGEGKVPQVIIHNVKKITDDDWFNYDKVLEPVNGLVCFINRRTAAARIYNVGTREVTPWIKSRLLAEEKAKFENEDNPVKLVSNLLQIYQMGFDPEKKEHKVFCFWRLSAKDNSLRGGSYTDDPGYASWEAFTVGRDTKWRRISMVPDENNIIKINEVLPPDCPERSPVHANGTIYWTNKRMSRQEDVDDPEGAWGDYAPTEPDVIIAFDVGSEKFRIIPIPSFILDEPGEKMLNRPIAMLVLGGRITLIYQMSNNIIKLWMLDDGVEKKLENCQGKGNSNWSAESIALPFYCDTRFFCFHGVATSPDKILISVRGKIGGGHKTMSWLHSYDRKTKALEEIEMDGSFLIPLHNTRSLFTTFTESLVPVQPQQDKSRQLELVF